MVAQAQLQLDAAPVDSRLRLSLRGIVGDRHVFLEHGSDDGDALRLD